MEGVSTMTMTITIPDRLARRVQEQASIRRHSPEDIALDILRMAAYLLDTNHASPLVTLQHPLRQRVLQHPDTGDSFAICVPVLAERL
jgi:hypothetical protein